METHASPLTAAIAFGAAGLGLVAQAVDVNPEPGLIGLTPDDVTLWTKAICNNLFTIVNTLVGCYHLLTVGRATARRRKAKRATPADVPAPHTETSAGAQPSA
jgi:hypothetical protein